MNRLFIAIILCAFLCSGCQSTRKARDERGVIERSLQERITAEAARKIVLENLDRDILAIQSAAATDINAQKELSILLKDRERSASKLESFLARSGEKGDLWICYTHSKSGSSCPTRGFAFVRNGQVIDYLTIVRY